ncbi:MAG: hypothetical protein LBI38_03305 [Oscillospiraceae bacterium]|jgi:transposase-like protein|nr:hypothetical protein [Oscillospiraceae bacterium]
MKKTKIIEGRACPKCESVENQMNYGFNRSGTQRCKCKNCNRLYTLNPKTRAFSDEIRQAAIKTHYSGVSGCGVGRIFEMNKANVYNWIKKAGK